MFKNQIVGALFSLIIFTGLHSLAQGASSLTALVAGNGTISVRDGNKVVATIAPMVYFEDWSNRDFSGAKGEGNGSGGTLELTQGAVGTLTASVAQAGDGLKITYIVTTSAPVAVQTVCTSFHLTASDWVGAPYALDDKQGTVGAAFKDTWLSSGDIHALALGPAPNRDGLIMTLTRETHGPTLFQDSRKWSDSLEIRASAHTGQSPWTWKTSEPQTFSFTLAFNRPVKVVMDKPLDGRRRGLVPSFR